MTDIFAALPPYAFASLINHGVQAAIGTTFATALLGAAISLRRPAMWSLGFCWLLFTIISCLMALIVLAPPTGASTRWLQYVPMVLLAGFMGAVYPAIRHAVQTVVVEDSPRLASTRVLLSYGFLAAALQVLGIVGVHQEHWTYGEPSLMLGPRIIGLSTAGLGALHALLEARRNHTVRHELHMLAFGFGLLAARAPVNALIAHFTGNGPEFEGMTIVVFANIVSCVFIGAASFVVALNQERRAYSVQVELVRQSNARQARTNRLESMGRLAAGIAHDFNNLLMVITGSTTMAREAEHQQERDKNLSEVQAAAERGIALIRQLLSFARAQPRAPERIVLADHLDRVTAMLRQIAGPTIEVRPQVDSPDVAIMLDPSQLDQILLNLVANARDAMPTGGVVCISIDSALSLNQKVDSRRFARLRVTDHGTGIPRETLDHIFDPFFTTKPEGSGTGLGLATVYGIVSQAQGEISVHSDIGVGTTFEILLPELERDVGELPSEDRERDMRIGARAAGGGT